MENVNLVAEIMSRESRAAFTSIIIIRTHNERRQTIGNSYLN